MTSARPKLCEVNVGYMSSIPASPTKYEVNYQILETAEEVMDELELDYIFMEVDQAIYTKVMDAKFQFPDKFQNVIVRMGSRQ